MGVPSMSPPSMSRGLRASAALLAFVAIAVLAISNAHAAPYKPASREVVLLELDGSQKETSAKLRAVNRTRNPEEAIALARKFIALGRVQHDERYFGYASATLQPWSATGAPIDVVLLRADIAQHQHRFDDARKILDELLTLDANHSTGRLMRATLHMSQGRPQAAQLDCQKLFSLRESFAATICLAQARSLSGQLADSYRLIGTLLGPQALESNTAQHGWAAGVAAEMAERLGDDAAAEKWLRQALALDANDLVARLDLCDLLLRTQRPRDADDLLAGLQPSESVLLRKALATKQLGNAAFDASLAAWRAAVERSEHIGVTLHLRELARGQLDLLQNADLALQTALKNWEVQREPVDARLLADAAHAAKNASALQLLRDWQSALRYEDRGLSL